jgi:drug/metabolite transporter (DMT)-like permease
METSNIADVGKQPSPELFYKSKQNRSIILVIFTVILWSFLAVLTTKLRHIPPFLLVGITLTLAGLFNLPLIKTWRVPFVTLVTGVAGIFGNLFFYYLAFQLAPPVEVNLINYLWPMLIVVLSPLFLKGYRLHIWHVLGVCLGLCGTFLIITGGKASFSSNYLLGYLSAFLGALFWVVYSLLIKKVPGFHYGAIGGFSLIAGILSLSIFFIQHTYGTSFPSIQPVDFVFLFLISIGPIALANLTWKMAIQNGDPRIFGSLSYLTPVLSTLNLVIFANQTMTPITMIAMVMVFSGALFGGMDTLKSIKNNKSA